MITFSFRPRSRSTLPEMAASVSTRVVSWKDAADSQLAVLSAALIKPSSTVCATDGSDRKSTRLNSSHLVISYAVFCLKKKKKEYSKWDRQVKRPVRIRHFRHTDDSGINARNALATDAPTAQTTADF